MDEHSLSPEPATTKPASRLKLRTSKVFEAQEPMLIWAVSIPLGDGQWRKAHLIADARASHFGLHVQAARPEDLKTNGALVALLRKHAPTASIGAPLHHPVSGDYWLPLYVGPSPDLQPPYWIQLAAAKPPELRFISVEATSGEASVLVRKSSQGTYTKRRPCETPPPTLPQTADYADASPLLFSASPVAAATVVAPDGGVTVLPDYQRQARDRLARRLKTLAKSKRRAGDHQADAKELAGLRRQTQALAAHLHLVPPAASAITLTDSAGMPVSMALDPLLSAGQNLAAFYTRLKKRERARVITTERQTSLDVQQQAMAMDLERLRQKPLALAEVEAIVARHLPSAVTPSSRRTTKAAPLTHKPWRVFQWRGADGSEAPPIEILVGKAAADSDRLCREARGNDWWCHVVSGTGSHVIIPARQLHGAPPPAGLRRAAAILALHFSKRRGDQSGEVYWSQRQHLRKRAGMAPGLWQIIKAETMTVRYDEADLRQLLGADSESAAGLAGEHETQP